MIDVFWLAVDTVLLLTPRGQNYRAVAQIGIDKRKRRIVAEPLYVLPKSVVFLCS